MQQIKVIAFDADDTLWDNQVFYDKVESEYVASRLTEIYFRPTIVLTRDGDMATLKLSVLLN